MVYFVVTLTGFTTEPPTGSGGGSGGSIPDSFLPFGTDYGDSFVPRTDDGNSEAVPLRENVVIFGSSHNILYVSNEQVAISIYLIHCVSLLLN